MPKSSVAPSCVRSYLFNQSRPNLYCLADTRRRCSGGSVVADHGAPWTLPCIQSLFRVAAVLLAFSSSSSSLSRISEAFPIVWRDNRESGIPMEGALHPPFRTSTCLSTSVDHAKQCGTSAVEIRLLTVCQSQYKWYPLWLLPWLPPWLHP